MSAHIPYTGLKEGEKLLWYGRKSLLSYLGRIVLAVIFIALMIIPYIGFIFLIIGVLLIISAMVGARANIYYVTNIRLIQEYRLFRRSIKETTLDKITDIVFNQGFFGRLVNFGSIHFHTAGTGFPGIDFEGIRDPLTVRGLVINAKDEYLKQK
jgi:uncharacterized membrane protein YdbT with pleckstrin-like domain